MAYSISFYGKMIADLTRRQAYLDAMQAVIQPGSIVLEIGTGPGVFALLAAQMGAGKVYAMEPDDSIEVARQLAAAAGLSERIEFMQGLSTALDLPERADVVVSDLRGVLPLFEGHLPAVVDARRRFLADGGRLIPERDSLWATVVSAEAAFLDLTSGWREDGLALDLRVPLQLVTNSWTQAHLDADQCLAEPQLWAVLEYRTLEDSGVAGDLSWQVTRDGRAHGLAIWFDTSLDGTAGFSNAPGRPKLIYGQGFFPFPRPVELRRGDHVTAAMRAARVGEDYVWQWVTSIGDPVRSRFEQSTLHGVPLVPSRLRKQAASHVPRLNENGRIARFVLERVDGSESLEKIARGLQAAFPTRFDHWRDALTEVGKLAADYS